MKLEPIIFITLLCITYSALAMKNSEQENLSRTAAKKLHRALRSGMRHQVIQYLKANIEIDVNARNLDGLLIRNDTLLMAAVNAQNMLYACETLIARGADIHAKNNFGETVLMLAAERGRSDICELLLKLGADPFIEDSSGQTALSNAVTYFYKYHRHQILHPINDRLRGSAEDRAQRIAKDFREYKKTGEMLAKWYRKQDTCVVILLACLKHHEHPAGKKLYHLTKYLLRPYLKRYTLNTMRAQIKSHAQKILGHFEIGWVVRNININL